jgi:NTE family protein
MVIKAFQKNKIGLALGGGVAHGLAHIGVIKVIEEEKIPIACVAGTSVGSLIGSLFAAGMGWKEMAETARTLGWKDFVRLTFPHMGIVRHLKFKETLDRLIQGKYFEDLAIPFAAVAVDLESGEEVVLRSGSVTEAVRASSSIPGIFEPTQIDGRFLVDGGLLNNVPCSVVRAMGAGFVIAVELNSKRPVLGPPKNILDILYRSFQIMRKTADNADEEADILITPDLGKYSYTDIKHIDELIACGEEAARLAITTMKKKAKL